MKIDSPACVVTGEKAVTLKHYEIDYSGVDCLVKIIRGGICGSDLHYYQHGRVGNYAITAPMILGHEVIGIIEKSDRAELPPETHVAINPSKPCGTCKYCRAKEENQCINMHFFGSAMYTPHIDGGFSQYKIVSGDQCIPYSATVDGQIMVFAEPLAVAIHAVKQAGDITGKKVFVSGVGPIGCLVAAAAKVLGAAEIVTADLSERCLQISLAMGADKAIAANSTMLDEYANEKGYFDISFEASGHPSSVNRCLQITRAKGNIVQVGMGGPINEFPMMTLIAKEISLIGTFRFTEEFRTAVNWLENKKINPLPLLSSEYNYSDFEQALIFAGDKSRASKVQLVF
ncbi:L-idonate 5-dehydrogenase [Yersinia proxima]|uniref:L-idonate 5-dehydrogenase n=1 Tax=Yersinia proxima TaxID=2890316 RepID=UPI001D11EFC2|nr:L-idonate 5-dehydrogenase [Yersinia proxima]